MTGETSSAKTPVAADSNQAKSSSPKLFRILGVVLVLVVLTGSVSAWYFLKYKPDHTPACNQEIINKTASTLSPSNYKTLKTMTDNIKKLPKYEKDPNCLYPIVQYDVYVKDEKSAKSDLSKLQKVYNPKVGFNKAYKQWGINNLKDVEDQVKSLTTFNEQINKNKIYVQ